LEPLEELVVLISTTFVKLPSFFTRWTVKRRTAQDIDYKEHSAVQDVNDAVAIGVISETLEKYFFVVRIEGDKFVCQIYCLLSVSHRLCLKHPVNKCSCVEGVDRAVLVCVISV